jgi:hypothetical protein
MVTRFYTWLLKYLSKKRAAFGGVVEPGLEALEQLSRVRRLTTTFRMRAGFLAVAA